MRTSLDEAAGTLPVLALWRARGQNKPALSVFTFAFAVGRSSARDLMVQNSGLIQQESHVRVRSRNGSDAPRKLMRPLGDECVRQRQQVLQHR